MSDIYLVIGMDQARFWTGSGIRYVQIDVYYDCTASHIAKHLCMYYVITRNIVNSDRRVLKNWVFGQNKVSRITQNYMYN